jgi:hypothetical protein
MARVIKVDPVGPLMVRLGAAVDLAVDSAIAGLGIIHSRAGSARTLTAARSNPCMELWRQSFSGPFLYYSGCRHLPAPLCAFVDFIGT